MIFQSEMAPRYEICVGLEKGHKTTPNTLVAKPSKKKVGSAFQHVEKFFIISLPGPAVRDLIREVKNHSTGCGGQNNKIKCRFEK